MQEQKMESFSKIEKFIVNDKEIKVMASGAKNAEDKSHSLETNKRKAIGFGKESEYISSPNKETFLLGVAGVRRAIGFGREGEVIKNETKEPKHAVGYGREGEAPVAVPKAKKAQKGTKAPQVKEAIGFKLMSKKQR
jgi:hypothetical protein